MHGLKTTLSVAFYGEFLFAWETEKPMILKIAAISTDSSTCRSPRVLLESKMSVFEPPSRSVHKNEHIKPFNSQ